LIKFVIVPQVRNKILNGVGPSVTMEYFCMPSPAPLLTVNYDLEQAKKIWDNIVHFILGLIGWGWEHTHFS